MTDTDFEIVYVANTRLPTEKAHGLATVKICEAFMLVGTKVTLVIPQLWRRAGDIFSEYGIKKHFDIRKVLTVDLLPITLLSGLNRITFLLQMVSFSIFSAIYCRAVYGKKGIVYFSHDYIPLYFLSLIGLTIYYDIHHFPGTNFMYKRVMDKSIGFSVQTLWKNDKIISDYKLPNDMVVYWPNGTDVEMFSVDVSRSDARRELGLVESGNIALYTGALFDWKGVDTLIASIELLKKDTKLYIVGGSKTDIEEFKIKYPTSINERIIFVSHVSRKDIILWMKAANVLVLPNTGKQKVSLYYTSPMKLFEYMASGTPIVSSRVPSIQEIVDETCVYFAEPDNPHSFAVSINEAIENVVKSKKLSEASQTRVAKYSWVSRANIITNHIKHLINSNKL